jgi:hypothetical protein
MEPLHFRPAPLPIPDFPFPSPIRLPRVATRSLLKNVSASGERRDAAHVLQQPDNAHCWLSRAASAVEKPESFSAAAKPSLFRAVANASL